MFSFTVRQKRAILRVLVISAFLGAALGWLLRNPDQPLLRAVLYGALAGLLTPSLVITARELIWHSRLVRLRFGTFTIINLALNAAAILLALQLAALPFPALGLVLDAQVFVAVSAIVVGFTGWYTIDRLLGTGVLFGLLTGRYHHPRNEERVFLFADLADSTPLAKSLGDLRFHSFLNRLFTEIGPAIDRYGGTVHRYVGDEAAVTWTSPSGFEDATCLRCSLAILDTVTEVGPSFQKEFGFAPRLRIALRAGEVVAGEISGPKREIVFSGDTVNTAARIEGVAGETNRSLVLSEALLNQLNVPGEVEIESLGRFQLKGRPEATELFAASRRGG